MVSNSKFGCLKVTRNLPAGKGVNYLLQGQACQACVKWVNNSTIERRSSKRNLVLTKTIEFFHTCHYILWLSHLHLHLYLQLRWLSLPLLCLLLWFNFLLILTSLKMIVVGWFKEQTLTFISPHIQILDGTGTQISTLHLLFYYFNPIACQSITQCCCCCCCYDLKSVHTKVCLLLECHIW